MRVNTSPYTEMEKAIIRRMWPVSSHDQIMEALPDRTICGIRQKAEQMGVAISPSTRRRRIGSLEPLLDDVPEAWYWLGFFLADGHITAAGQFVVMLSDKDEAHLRKMSEFLGAKVTRPYSNAAIVYRSDCPDSMRGDELARRLVRIAIMDGNACDRIKSRLGLTSSRKTENPPEVSALERLSDDQLDWLFMGFFDGDGCVGLRWAFMEIHGAWRPVLDFWHRRGLVRKERPSSHGKKHAVVGIPVAVLRSLHSRHSAVLPLLDRKWRVLVPEPAE